MTWGFKNQSDAIRLRDSLLGNLPAASDALEAIISRGLIWRTPEDGIPARDGKKCGKARCRMFYIDDDDELVPFKVRGVAVSEEVWNIATEDIAGNTYIQTKDIMGKPVADWEPCSDEESSSSSSE